MPPTIPKIPVGTSLAGKTVIITGGNAGLGYEAARQYLQLHAERVILAVRSRSKGQDAAARLRADPTIAKVNPSATIEFMELDLDDYQSGLEFVRNVKENVPELDVLLCNGGVGFMRYYTAASGHERVMQVNCYTHFLIILELLPLLRSTAQKRGEPSHMTIVGSSTQTLHTLTKKPLGESESVYDHFDDRKVYNGIARYSDSKMAVSAFCRELAERVPASEVIVNNPCPGMVAGTGFDSQLPVWLRPIMFILRHTIARPLEDGARTLIHASYVAGKDTHGKYISNNKIHQYAPYLDEDAGRTFSRKLWEETYSAVVSLDPTFKEGQ